MPGTWTAFLVFLFDTLLGTLIFVGIALIIKAAAEREERPVEEVRREMEPRSSEAKG